MRCEFVDCAGELGQVVGAVRAGGGAHGEEVDLAVGRGLFEVGGEA